MTRTALRQLVTSVGASWRGRLRLCVPPVIACAADVAMTLRGQPIAYWTGGYRETDEMNPAARLLLELHPASFVAAAAVSALVVAALTVTLRRPLAVPLAFVVTFAHAVAAAAWMVRGSVTVAGVFGSVVLLVCTERLVAWSWRDAPIGAALPRRRAMPILPGR